jgi:hypothetical protein
MPEEKDSNKPVKELPKTKFEPPFDFYGVSPTFFIDGKDKLTSWIGCICSLILLAILSGVSIYYLILFFRKDNMSVNSKVDTLDKFPFIDLAERKFLFVVRGNYPEDGPFRG